MGIGRVVAATVVALSATPVMAQQSPEVGAPLIKTEASGRQLWGGLRVLALGDGGDWSGPAPLMRAPEATGLAHAWFAPSHSLVTGYLAEPAKPYAAYARVDVDATGKIAACTYREPPTTALQGDELCRSLRDAIVFRPALDQEGRTVPGHANIVLTSIVQVAEADGKAPPLFWADNSASPPPPPPPPAPKLPTRFPPDQHWTYTYTVPNLFAVVPATGSAPVDDRMTGLVFGGAASPLKGCAVVASSGDPKFDKTACKYVEKTIRPSWEPRVLPIRNAVAFLVGGDPKAPVAYYADSKKALRPRVAAAKESEFTRAMTQLIGPQSSDWRTAFQIGGTVDASGRLSKCRISRSSGRDATDIAACRLLKEGSWFEAGTDVFGRPVARDDFYWNATDARRALES